jgi:SAM-dependent methyltransferase
MPVAMPNREMAEAWEREAEGWLAQAERYDHAGRRHLDHMLANVDIAGDARVLDVGCGGGRSTIEVARRADAGDVLGIDISLRMIEYARRAAEAAGLRNVTFEHGDAQVHPFAPRSFDLTVSVFGTMFFDDPAAAFANIARAMRPGGRLAILVWRELSRNEWITAIRGALALGRDLPEPPAGAPGPFALADPERVPSILGGAGFRAIDLAPVEEPIEFGRDADDALDFVATLGITKGLTEGLDEDDRRRGMEGLRRVLEEHETPAGVLFGTAASLVTATVDARA